MMIMDRQLKSRLEALLADLVQEVGTPFTIVEGLNGGQGEEVVQADLLSSLDLLFKFSFISRCNPMGARTPQPVGIENAAEFAWRPVKEGRERLDFPITYLHQLLQGSFEILFTVFS